MGKGVFQNLKGLSVELLLPAMLLLWAAGSWGLFRAEMKGLRKVPELLSLGYDERKFSYEGPVHALAYNALRAIPAKSVIYLYNPAIDARAASFFYLKLRYDLYPRKVVDMGNRLDIDGMIKSGYVVYCIPRDTWPAQARALDGLPFLNRVFEYDNADGYVAIYRVGRPR